MIRTLQVSQISKIIKDIVDNEMMFENVNVVGEISSFSVTRGIAYFVIKDNDSMLNCVMFNCYDDYKIGDSVIVTGAIKYYSKGGKLSLNAYKIEAVGQGELYQQFLFMKEKLAKEGLFDNEHKKPIPSYIKRIGVVTSKTGAVLQDIINVRTRRNPNLDIVLYDAQVQGILAKQQIINGINFFSNYDKVDCIIVARGGGSLEDLQPFNEEEVARAVYNCNKPIISAVGHETDFTIIDFVSDLRAPTPSAAAELVAFDLNEARNTIDYYKDKLNKHLENVILDNQMQLNDIMKRIELSVGKYFSDIKLYLNSKIMSMSSNIDTTYTNTRYRVNIALNTLDNLNPAKILAKGYSVVKKETNYETTFANININDIISIENNEDKLSCKVLDKTKK